MFEITKVNENRLDITINGQIDADGMRKGLDALSTHAADMTDATMLYTITNMALPTLGAIGVEFAQLPQLFGLIGKFRKCAVLTDTAWISKAAEIEGFLIPGLEIKAFALDDVSGAEAWLD